MRWFWVVALILLSFGLRLNDLEARSLWLDEGFSLLRIQAGWRTLLANVIDRQGFQTVDIHPPLYFALVKVWSAFTGSQVFTWRLFSAFCSTLLVPATIILARRAAGRHAEGLAGVLAALSPAYLWYAAEVRMYALVALLGCFGTYFALRTLDHAQPIRHFLKWLLISVAAAFTHYSLLIMVSIQAAFVLRRVWRASWLVLRRLSPYRLWLPLVAFAGVGGVALFLVAQPTLRVLVTTADQAIRAPDGGGADPVWFAHEIGNAVVFGLNAGDPSGGLFIWTAWAAALLGGIWLRKGEVTKQAITLCTLILPFIAWLALANLIENSPTFRYVAFSFPVVHVLVARLFALLAQGGVWSRFGALALATMMVGTHLFGMRMTFTPTPTWQDDWRGIAGYLKQHLRPSDGVLLGIHASEAALGYYLGWSLDRFESVGKWHAFTLTEAQAAISSTYSRVWVILSGSDDDFWNRFALSLVEPYTLVREVPFPARTTALRVLLYEALLPTQPSIAAVPNARGNRCEAQLCLARAGLTYPSPDYDRPGFGLNVIWVGGQGSARPGHLSVRLLHAGETWLDFQLDPGLEGASAQNLNGGGYATFYNVPLWLGLPPLAYQLVLSALDADGRTLQTWAVELSTSEVLKYLRVTQSDSPSLWRGKEIELASVEVPQAIQQGNALPVVLTWKTNRASTPHWLTRFVLLDSQSRERLVAERDMRSTTWPVAQWPAGELVRDQYALPTSELAPGAYQLVLRREREGRLLNEFALAEVRIVEPPLEPVETRFDHPVAAEVGPLTLLGYSVERHNAESSQVTILTFWRVNQPPRVDGRLFVHLLDARGNPVAQDDGAPFNGARTMLSLRASEGIRQAHRLRLPSPLEPGKYRLFAGAYNSVDMERWPVTQGGKPGQHNLVFLGEIDLP